MLYDASSRKDVRRAERAAQLRESTRTEFIRAALSTLQGRAWFWHFLEQCHLFSDPFSGDALREAYSKGERNIVLSIYHEIVTHCPDQFVLMCREAQVQETLDERRYIDRDDSDTADDDEPTAA